jgi:hypothetical protein
MARAEAGRQMCRKARGSMQQLVVSGPARSGYLVALFNSRGGEAGDRPRAGPHGPRHRYGMRR